MPPGIKAGRTKMTDAELKETKRLRAKAYRDSRTEAERDEYNRRRREAWPMSYNSNFTPEQRAAYNANRNAKRARQRALLGYSKDAGLHPTIALKLEHERERERAERERQEERDRIKRSRFYRPSWAEGDHHV